MKKFALLPGTTLLACLFLFLISCRQNPQHQPGTEIKKDSTAANKNRIPADVTTILTRKQVPILCYHHIRNILMPGRSNKGYEVTAEAFQQQMKILADSGYHTILPDQLYDYLVYSAPLPSRPVMITFDDTDEEQFTVGKTEMDKYGFKGVYFIMNISIGRPHYMTKEQLKQLSDEGHAICSHTYDHHRVDRYKELDTVEFAGQKKQVNDWDFQLTDPKKKLEEITGKPVNYFAYPFGIWNQAAIPEIKKRGFKLAFQLSEKRDSTEPLFTVRRMIVASTWTPQGVLKVMKSTFK